MNGFAGFPPAAWSFLEGLERDNTAAFFDRNRAAYQTMIAEPSRALVTDLAPRLAADVHPLLAGEARIGRSLFRINRDTRFSADKTPYKTHVDFVFWAGDGDPRTSAACILRLTSTTVLTGAGRIGIRGADLPRHRAMLDDAHTGPALRAVVDRLLASGATMSDAVRARPPRPYTAEHLNADLLRRDGFHLSTEERHPACIAHVGFVDWLVQRLTAYAELVDLLR